MTGKSELEQCRYDNQRIGRAESALETQWFVSFALFIIGLLFVPALFGIVVLIIKFKTMIGW